MRLPDAAHTDQPWRIHELAPDFHLEDVWALDTPGGPDDLGRMVEVFVRGGERLGGPAGALMSIRLALGKVFRLDTAQAGLDHRVRSLRHRLPADLLDGERGPELADVPFAPLYLTHDEYVAEIANSTVHALLHIGWVSDGSGGYRGQLAVLVKPNGRLGQAYLAAIRPFRYLIVYPALLKSIQRAWAAANPVIEPQHP